MNAPYLLAIAGIAVLGLRKHDTPLRILLFPLTICSQQLTFKEKLRNFAEVVSSDLASQFSIGKLLDSSKQRSLEYSFGEDTAGTLRVGGARQSLRADVWIHVPTMLIELGSIVVCSWICPNLRHHSWRSSQCCFLRGSPLIHRLALSGLSIASIGQSPTFLETFALADASGWFDATPLLVFTASTGMKR